MLSTKNITWGVGDWLHKGGSRISISKTFFEIRKKIEANTRVVEFNKKCWMQVVSNQGPSLHNLQFDYLYH